jgi:hypothetical protein
MKSNKFLMFFLIFLLAGKISANRLEGPFTFDSGAFPRGLAAADLDGNGIPEIIVANFGSHTLIGHETSGTSEGNVVIFKSEAEGLVKWQTLATGLSPRGVAVGDINQDDRSDIIVTNYDENSISVFLQNPDNTFAPGIKIATGNKPVGIDFAEIFGTAWVAVTCYLDNEIRLYKALSGGELLQVSQVAVGQGPTDLIFYEDGFKPLLLSANFLGNSISVLSLSQQGLAAEAVNVPLAGNPCKMAVGDINGNNRQEIVVALFGESKVAVISDLFDSESGTQKVSLTGRSPNSLTLGKVSGSDNFRILTANRDSDNIDILGADKDGQIVLLGSLKVPDGESTEFGPVDIVATDLNRDSKADVVLTHMRTNSIKVFYQRQPAAVELTSPTHPDPDKWYSQSNAVFAYAAPSDLDGIVAFAYILSDDPFAELTTDSLRTTQNEISFSNLETGQYYFKIAAVDLYDNFGEVTSYKIGVTAEMSRHNTYNYPNPSRDGNTTIRFPLTKQQEVKIYIYDETSRLVWKQEIPAEQTIAGVNRVLWTGINDRGNQVANGGYILKVQSENITVVKKIAIIR